MTDVIHDDLRQQHAAQGAPPEGAPEPSVALVTTDKIAESGTRIQTTILTIKKRATTDA